MHSSISPDSNLYKALLAQYVHQLVHQGHSMEFFLEGGRSRDGKVSRRFAPRRGEPWIKAMVAEIAVDCSAFDAFSSSD